MPLSSTGLPIPQGPPALQGAPVVPEGTHYNDQAKGAIPLHCQRPISCDQVGEQSNLDAVDSAESEGASLSSEVPPHQPGAPYTVAATQGIQTDQGRGQLAQRLENKEGTLYIRAQLQDRGPHGQGSTS